MIAAMWCLSITVWVYAGWKVGSRIFEQRARLAEVEKLQEFSNLVARDCLAGARPPEAIRAASEALDLPQFTTATFSYELGGGIPVGHEDSPEQNHFFHLWRIAHTYGLSLGALADHHVADIRAQLDRYRTTSSAMAGARLTVIVLLSLPVGAVTLGQTMGLGTAQFYTHSALGGLLLVVGSVMGAGGVLWTEHLSVTVLGGVGRRAGPDSPLGAARILDVVAAALRAGAPLAQAWEVGMSLSSDSSTTSTHHDAQLIPSLLALGAGARAWDTLTPHPHFGTIARLAAQHTKSGAMLAESMSQHAAHLRTLAAAEATEGAEKMLIILAAPLTLCFLPTFVLTGLVPLAIGLAGV